MHLPRQRSGDSFAAPVRGDHAVVLGASMSGLLAARVLADHFAQVTVVERDRHTAEHDPVMAWRFIDVTGFEQSPSALFAPDSIRRLASDSRHHRRTGSASELAASAARGWTWP